MMVLYEYCMLLQDIVQMVKWIGVQNLLDLCGRLDILVSWMDLVLLVSQVLCQFVLSFCLKLLVVLFYGICEGLFYEQMFVSLWLCDLLLEVVWFFECQMVCIFGFGKWLYQFFELIFKNVGLECDWLIKVVCFLYDMIWCMYFDYCVDVCFDNVMCVNMVVLEYFEWVFLGFVLLYCYKNSCVGLFMVLLFVLLNEKQIVDVEIFGKVMCFGVMLLVKDLIEVGEL